MMLLEQKKMWRVNARRGSILVLVLGILAMMAVFAAVYLAIGVGDQRAASALEVRQEQQEVAPMVAGHIASAIGRDRMAVVYRMGSQDGGVVNRAYRETTDYPSTDYSRLSIPELSGISPAQVDLYRFNPEGTHLEPWLGLPLANPDPRVSDDPYLASLEPVYLGTPGEREYPADPTKWWLDRRDWQQISNLAPDGLHVNLFALRNNFDAPRGIQNPDEMSYWLSLIQEVSPGVPGSRLQATDATSGQTHVPGLTMNPVEMRNRPFFWTMNQRNMFFPINQPFTMLDPSGNVAGWESAYYPDYQYADTDGDGFADARWFELVDSTLLGRELDLMPDTGEYRIFVAARVVDLSGLVNVNTASDASVGPTALAPLGSSPAEIDVRRLLTMEDAALNYRSVVGDRMDLPLSYSSISRPAFAGTPTVEDPASDYSLYAWDTSTPGSADPTLSVPNAGWAGWFAYDALHRAFGVPAGFWTNSPSPTLPADLRGFVIAPSNSGFPYVPADGDAAIDLFSVTPFEFSYTLPSAGETLLTLEDLDHRALMRRLRYDTVGAVPPHRPAERPEGMDEFSLRFGRGLFGVADLSELLTYRGLNDAASTSRLEATIDSRYDDANPNWLQTTRRFGPLRSNRALAYERLGLDDSVRGAEFLNALPMSDGIIDGDALALATLSPRQRLTTMSGAADLSGVQPLQGSASRFPTRLQPQEAKPRLRSVAQNLSSAFNVYRLALAPHADIDFSWDAAGTGGFESHRTLFYGYGGPDLAMRTAAHLAVNLRDQYDGDSASTVATLVMSEQTSFPLANDPNWQPQDTVDSDRRLFPGAVNGARLRPPVAHMNPSAADPDEMIVNVYGVEAQPFIVEAMSINVFTDAPRLTGLPSSEPNGDVDFNPAGCMPPPPPPNPQPRPVSITIGGKLKGGDWQADGLGGNNLWDANADFVMQVFAVKLHNPFNVPVTLGGGASGPKPVADGPLSDDPGPRNFDYYIEFGGRYFKLAQYLPPTPAFPQYRLSPVTLRPGQTRVFYVLAQEDEEEIVRRWSRYVNAYGGVGVGMNFGDIEDWLEEQFDMEELAGNNDPVWIRRFNPETGLLINVQDSTVADPEFGLSDRGYSFDDLWEYPPPRDGNGDSEDDYVIPSVASGGSAAREPDWRVVRLWKKFVTNNGGQNGNPDRVESNWTGSLSISNNDPGTDNWVENDILVDRLREPEPLAFAAPTGTSRPTPEERIGHLDSRPTYDGGYDLSSLESPRVSGTIGCEQSLRETVNGFPNDNTGWTIAMHASIRRPGFADDWYARESNGEERLRRGVLPIWCLEAISTGQNISYNIPSEAIPDGTLDDSDFVFSTNRAFRKFRDFVNSTGPVEETFNQTPNEWDGPDAGEWPGRNSQRANENLYDDFLYGRAYPANAPRPREAGFLFPEVHVRNDQFQVTPWAGADPVDISRVTDILTPLAIGPEYAPFARSSYGDPYIGDPLDSTTREPGRYLTLSEAYALALGFDGDLDLEYANGADDIPDGDGTVDDDVYNRFVYFDLGKRQPMQPPGAVPQGDWEYVFDAGHLWLDKFVPFVDQSLHSDPTTGPQILYEPPTDVAVGARVTPAMQLLDSVQTASSTASAEQFLQRAVPGRININTAPLPVLRSIGMLSPSTSWDGYGVPEHWAWRLANQYGNVPADPSGLNPDPYLDWAENELGLPDLGLMDSAATISSYRDRLHQTEFRLSSWPADPATGQPVLDPLAYSGFGASADPFVNPYPPTGVPVPPNGALAADNRKDDFGRQSITGIPGLREAPGFASVGEVVAARVRADLEDVYGAAGLPFLAEEVAPNQLDYLGTDRREGLAYELKTFEYSSGQTEFRTPLEGRKYAEYDPFDSGSTYDATKVFFGDEIGNDYDEKLVLTSQLMNLVTTRSDLFAVWFVVRGYTEADVSNLGDSDPMLPSLEKRYLMIVDRSKVGTWIDRNGDGVAQEEYEIVSEPEIVLLREVPR